MATTTVPSETFVDGSGVLHVNDIRVVGGRLTTVSGKEAYANIVACVVRTRLGELPLDSGRGIPYFETVFQTARLTPDFEASLRARIEELYFVEDVTDLVTEFDRARGVLTYTATIETVDGETVSASGAVGESAFVNDLIASAGGGTMSELVRDGQFYLPVHKKDGVQLYRILTDSVNPDNGVQPAISEEVFRKNPATGNFEEVPQA